jgi:UDP-N-acetylmuramate dehydrogenase
MIDTIRGRVLKNEPMSGHTSFAIGGPTDYLVYPEDREDLTALLRWIRKRRLPSFVLGGGTNLLVRDGGFRGVIISLRRLQKVALEREYRSIGGAFAVISAEAGALLAQALALAAEEGLTGLEFAAGIPGTIGGAVCMNAGTSAGEMGDIVESVTLLSPEGTLVAKERDEMGFGYRTSSVPDGHVVLEARMALRRDDKEKIRDRIRELLETRKQLQPAGLPNAGSMFKNPQEESAGKLIEEAGLKGRKVGGARVSDKHANFIVNAGRATARDVLQLMELVKKTVLEERGVRLEPEIRVIGED